MGHDPGLSDLTAYDAVLKNIYPPMRVEALAKKNRPLLQWIPRGDEFYGKAYVVPVNFEDPQGRSADLEKAIDNASASSLEDFIITQRKSDYGVVLLDAETMKASSKQIGSYIESKSTEINGKIRNLGKSLHISLYRNGSGSIGKIAGISGDVVTLTRETDVHNFGRGQVVVSSTADGGGSVKAHAKVVKRDLRAKTVEFDDVPGAWAEDDFLFTEGDYDEKVTGLEGWIPLTAPGSSDSFFTVNRSVDVTRLAGQRVDVPGRSILENAQELALLIGEESAGSDDCALFMNPRAGMQLLAEVGAEVFRSPGGKAKSGFTGFTIENFITGPIDVHFDIACPEDRAYMLDRKSWKLIHMGGVPHLAQEDGLTMLRRSKSDSYEVRARYWAELICKAPARNGVMSVALS